MGFQFQVVASIIITLISKKTSYTTFSDFRPISLCNFLNKVFTKILTERLKGVLPILISDEQSTFLTGRDITDNILLTQDLCQFLKHKSVGDNVIIKLDMMKAFERVFWSFLVALLSAFGFPSRFIAPIMSNLQSNWFSILINGSPSGLFKASRGLKQGDPLSLYLFILLSEAFSRRLNALAMENKICKFGSPVGSLPPSHLSFDDDVVIFSRATGRSLSALSELLIEYEIATGHKVSKEKSNFYIKEGSRRAREIIRIMGMQPGSFPFVYLGGRIFFRKEKVSYFQFIIDSMVKRLSN